MAGIVVVGFFIMRMTMKRAQKSQVRSQRSVEEKISDGYRSRQTFEQMNELMANLADLSRQINGQLDTRITRLQVLLRKSDEQISLLEDRLNQIANASENLPNDLNNTNHANLSTESSSDSSSPFRNNSPDRFDTESSPEIPKPVEITPDMQRVLDLLNRGHNAIAIAQELNRPVGEIELILALTGRKKNT